MQQTSGEFQSFDLLKKLMLDKGDKFVKIAELSRQKIARNGGPHIKENAVSGPTVTDHLLWVSNFILISWYENVFTLCVIW